MFSMLNEGGISDSSREHSEDRFETRQRATGGPSRSMILPSRESSRGNERSRAIEAVRQSLKSNKEATALASGPSASVGHPNRSRPVPETLAEARDDIEQATKLKGKKDLTEDEIENYAKLVMAEYLHDGDEKVRSCFSRRRVSCFIFFVLIR